MAGYPGPGGYPPPQYNPSGSVPPPSAGVYAPPPGGYPSSPGPAYHPPGAPPAGYPGGPPNYYPYGGAPYAPPSGAAGGGPPRPGGPPGPGGYPPPGGSGMLPVGPGGYPPPGAPGGYPPPGGSGFGPGGYPPPGGSGMPPVGPGGYPPPGGSGMPPAGPGGYHPPGAPAGYPPPGAGGPPPGGAGGYPPPGGVPPPGGPGARPPGPGYPPPGGAPPPGGPYPPSSGAGAAPPPAGYRPPGPAGPGGYPPPGQPQPGPGGPPPGGRPGVVLPQVAPFDYSLFPNREKEPMLLLDTTGSMNWPTSPTDQTPRREVVREAIGLLVSALGKQDSQAAHEAEGGGLRTVTFSGGNARDLEDLNPRNLQAKWGSIRWQGGTLIIPGWNKLIEVYNQEFGSKPPHERPLLLALIITDGDASDTAEFTNALRQAASGGVYACVALIGFGDEHDSALAKYRAIAASNANVRVFSLSSETNPQVIADSLVRMIE